GGRPRRQLHADLLVQFVGVGGGEVDGGAGGLAVGLDQRGQAGVLLGVDVRGHRAAGAGVIGVDEPAGRQRRREQRGGSSGGERAGGRWASDVAATRGISSGTGRRVVGGDGTTTSPGRIAPWARRSARTSSIGRSMTSVPVAAQRAARAPAAWPMAI